MVQLLVVVVASTSKGLTTEDVARATAADDGRRFLVALLAGIAVAIVATLAWTVAERRVVLSPRARVVVGALLSAAAAAAVVGWLASYGGPVRAVETTMHAFDTEHPADTSLSLNTRLASLSGSGRADLWRVALSDWRGAPVVGTGAGSFERSWERSPRWTHTVTDAHSLFLETAAETGLIGLAVLVAALALPLWALVSARHQPVMAAAVGAYAAFLVHAATDWDWELPAVTLTVVFLGCAGLIALRNREPRSLGRPTRIVGTSTAAVVALAMWIGYAGEDSIDRANASLSRRDAARAAVLAGKATRWAPWSPYGPTTRGEALLQLDRQAQAGEAFRQAIGRDGRYWRAWLGLAAASNGRVRADAMRRATALYPKSVEIAETRDLLSH